MRGEYRHIRENFVCGTASSGQQMQINSLVLLIYKVASRNMKLKTSLFPRRELALEHLIINHVCELNTNLSFASEFFSLYGGGGSLLVLVSSTSNREFNQLTRCPP